MWMTVYQQSSAAAAVHILHPFNECLSPNKPEHKSVMFLPDQAQLSGQKCDPDSNLKSRMCVGSELILLASTPPPALITA